MHETLQNLLAIGVRKPKQAQNILATHIIFLINVSHFLFLSLLWIIKSFTKITRCESTNFFTSLLNDVLACSRALGACVLYELGSHTCFVCFIKLRALRPS